MAQGKTKVKAKVPKLIAKKQKQKGKGKAFTQRSSKFFCVLRKRYFNIVPCVKYF